MQYTCALWGNCLEGTDYGSNEPETQYSAYTAIRDGYASRNYIHSSRPAFGRIIQLLENLSHCPAFSIFVPLAPIQRENVKKIIGFYPSRIPERVSLMLDRYISAGIKMKETRGRKALVVEQQQNIYDTRHEHSIVTVDRRNGRDQVIIKKIDFYKFEHLKLPDDILVENFVSKRNQEMVNVHVEFTPKLFLKSIK